MKINIDNDFDFMSDYIISKLKQAEEPVELSITCLGGSVSDAIDISIAIRECKQPTTAIIHYAMSAATLISSACDKVIVYPSSMFMIHNPSLMAIGDHAEIEKAGNSLEAYKKSMLGYYTERTGKNEEDLSKAMDKETWFTGEEIVNEGFADEFKEKMPNSKNQGIDNILKIAATFGGSTQPKEVNMTDKLAVKAKKIMELEAAAANHQLATKLAFDETVTPELAEEILKEVSAKSDTSDLEKKLAEAQAKIKELEAKEPKAVDEKTIVAGVIQALKESEGFPVAEGKAPETKEEKQAAAIKAAQEIKL